MAKYTILPDKNNPSLRLKSGNLPDVELTYRAKSKTTSAPFKVHSKPEACWKVDLTGERVSFTPQTEFYDVAIVYSIASAIPLEEVIETGIYQVGNLRLFLDKAKGLVLQTVTLTAEEVIYERLLVPANQVNVLDMATINLYLRKDPSTPDFKYRLSIYPEQGLASDYWYDTEWSVLKGLVPIEKWLDAIKVPGGKEAYYLPSILAGGYSRKEEEVLFLKTRLKSSKLTVLE